MKLLRTVQFFLMAGLAIVFGIIAGTLLFLYLLDKAS